MASASDILTVELAIEYTFKQKDLLTLALTAAGAKPENHDGNRKLAKFGQTAIHFAIASRGYKESVRPGKFTFKYWGYSAEFWSEDINAMHTFFQSKEQRAAVVDSIGIVSCMKLCDKPGATSKTVKSLAFSALIGAAWLDSGSVDIVADILARLYHIPRTGPPALKLTNPSLDTESNRLTIPATVHPADTLLTNSEPGSDPTIANNDIAESLFPIGPEEYNVDFEGNFYSPILELNEMTRDLMASRAVFSPYSNHNSLGHGL